MGDLYIQYEYWFAALQLIFAMLGMGATLTIRDFSNEFKTPKGLIAGTTVQLICSASRGIFFHKQRRLGGRYRDWDRADSRYSWRNHLKYLYLYGARQQCFINRDNGHYNACLFSDHTRDISLVNHPVFTR